MKRLVGLMLAILTVGCSGLPAYTFDSGGWSGAWGASPTPPPLSGAKTFENQTLRQLVRLSVGGAGLRIRLTNEYGDEPLEIGGASVALAWPDGTPAHTPLTVTFSGARNVVIPPRSPMLSDPVRLDVKALDQVSVSLYLASSTGPCTCHFTRAATAFISPPGDFTDTIFAPIASFPNRAFISAVEVFSASPRTIVALGDSITDGTGSSINANRRWTDVLAERLTAQGANRAISNQSIPGNRLLAYENPIYGDSALARFDRDVMSVPNVGWLIVLEGINDISMGDADPPSAATLINGYKQIIARAHANGIKVYGATLTPYEGGSAYQESGEKVRQTLNTWIRTSGTYDGVIDLDAVLRDPANPKKMRADLQSGDWLHPNDEGYKVMGEAIDLALFH